MPETQIVSQNLVDSIAEEVVWVEKRPHDVKGRKS